MRQACPFSPVLFNIVPERQDKNIRGVQIEKKEIKISMFADDMILCLKNPKDSTKNSYLMNTLGKITG
jgi:hypothetical protein